MNNITPPPRKSIYSLIFKFFLLTVGALFAIFVIFCALFIYLYFDDLKNNPLTVMGGARYACDENRSLNVGPYGKCSSVCPNRYEKGSFCLPKCGQGIFKHLPLTNSMGECHSCNDENSFYIDEADNCEKVCPNRHIYKNESGNGGWCAYKCGTGTHQDKPLTDSLGSCYSCDSDYPVHLNENDKCSEICPHRKLNEEGECIHTDACGFGKFKNKPLTLSDGTCAACNHPALPIIIKEGTPCHEVCPNNELYEGEYTWRRKGESVCRPKCPPNKPLLSHDAKCFSCETAEELSIAISEECSSLCPNRELNRYSWCVQKKTGEKPLKIGRESFACDDPENLYTGNEEACLTPCPNRIFDKGFCRLTACPANMPLVDVFGDCFTCDTPMPIHINWDGKCEEVCQNRRLVADGPFTECRIMPF